MRRACVSLSVTVCAVLAVALCVRAAPPPASCEPDTAGVSVGKTGTGRVESQKGPTPLLVFAAIEKAWASAKADPILALFPEDKIVIHLERTMPEKAFFTRKQADYVLRDAFRFTATQSFEFLEFKFDKEGSEAPFALAEWSFRREPEGESIVEKVLITLRKEKDRWLISGIRIQN